MSDSSRSRLPLRHSNEALYVRCGCGYQRNRHERGFGHRENRHHHSSCSYRSPTPPRQHGPSRPPRSVILPTPRPPNTYSPNNHSEHPAPVPPYISELATAIFSAPTFLHLYLAPGQLGVLASPELAHQNPDVTRPVIILHPGKDYKKLIERVGHAVKSVNPPAWGVSDIPPATWEGWGVKLFLPKDGPRIFKDIWETVGEKFHHLEVRLIPPQSQIDFNWFCVTSEQIMALENTRWDEEVEMYGRLGRMKYAEDVPDEPGPAHL
ncbi:hypothetical protein L211DRAFT_867334 [Terfezia boudieri ATCC MYA-4762]|uniref:Uncharacterized protein n=1 Tax=Terfezia boudieri ATCC MYA-4762 TaxID=1051890 RepID=A0A3N4LR72_9PEZI|nr:hypothetical protein L211DRAFT_867334 [Terfezia boudieri ATCC MYA-4762]